MGDRGPHSHIILLLEELIVHLILAVCGSQTNLQQLHDGVHMKDRSASVIVMEPVTDNLHGLSTGTLVKRLTSKLIESI
jgi:hypothetical protein